MKVCDTLTKVVVAVNATLNSAGVQHINHLFTFREGTHCKHKDRKGAIAVSLIILRGLGEVDNIF